MIFSYGYSQTAWSGPTTYRNPEKVDMNSTFDAQRTLQSRYNNNKDRLQDAIYKIGNHLSKISKTSEESTYLNNIFTERCIKKMPNFNLGSDTQVTQTVNFLYDCINYQLDNL